MPTESGRCCGVDVKSVEEDKRLDEFTQIGGTREANDSAVGDTPGPDDEWSRNRWRSRRDCNGRCGVHVGGLTWKEFCREP